MDMTRQEIEERNNRIAKNNAIEMYLTRKYLFAAVFLLLLLCFSGMNIYENWETISTEVVETVKYYARKDRDGQNEFIYWASLGTTLVQKCEDEVNDNLIFSKGFLWANGFYSRVTGKHEIKDFKYYKDQEGYLQYGAYYREDDGNVFEYAKRVRRLKDSVASTSANVIFIVTPSKYTPGKTKIPAGTPINDPNHAADELIMDLNRLGIETLDLRNVGLFDKMSYEDSFFRTDHHWTIPAAFECAKVVNDTLKERFDIDLDPDGITLSANSYRTERFDDVMYGSMGRGAGLGFIGMESFTVMWPDYDCHFDRRSIRNAAGYEEHKYGDCMESLMNLGVFLNRDPYSDSHYSVYLNGMNYKDHIENLDYPDRPKVMLIRDSYFSPVLCFLAAGCGQIDSVWTLEDSNVVDAEETLKQDEYDLIIIETYPYAINDGTFNFFK